jgi:hypothetical protein
VIGKGFLKAAFEKAASPVLGRLDARNARTERILQAQIDLVANKNEICSPVPMPEQLEANSLPIQDGILEDNAVLTFYAEESVAKRIRDFTTETGHRLIHETVLPDGRKQLSFWNERTRAYDRYEEIYTEKGGNGMNAQFAAYYDVTNNRISINYGGMNYANKEDIKSALQTLSGAPDMLMTRVKGCLDKMTASFNELYPGQLADTPVDVYAHSAGATALPLTNYFLQREHGICPRAQVMFDPFGAKNSFERISAIIARAEGRDPNQVLGELTHNTVSFKAAKGTFVDRLGSSADTVGTVIERNIEGNIITRHLGKAFVKEFNHAEVAQASAPRQQRMTLS